MILGIARASDLGPADDREDAAWQVIFDGIKEDTNAAEWVGKTLASATMCELTVAGSVAERREGYEPLVRRLRREVELAKQGALATHANWVSEISSLTRADESAICALLMTGEYCEAGRLLGIAVRRQVLESASEKAKEAAYQQYGIDID